MSFGTMLYTLLITPLETAFELIYTAALKMIHHPGPAIICLSLVMNVLLLPLYRRTDAIQEEAIATDKKMKPFIAHIKKTFKGDERFMMLQTCYRQHNYKPYDAIKGIAPLLLEIPFFMAAYNFLSHLQLLQGCAFGPIPDLGAPDGLLVIGSLSVNLLPILMTLINAVSSAIYTKGAPAKTKVQLYGMAALFLVLLYDSPAGLVFYWTLNNLFSLVKNALMKMKRPMLVLGCAATPLSVAGLIYTAVAHPHASATKWAVAVLGALLLNVPLAAHFAAKKRQDKPARQVTATKKDRLTFGISALLLTLLVGLAAPTALIHASPEEFIHIDSIFTPHTYVLYTCLVAAGFFLVWLGVFYALATPLWKRVMAYATAAGSAMAAVDYLFFGKGYGNLSNQLIFDEPIANTLGAVLLNTAVLAAVAGLWYVLFRKKAEIIRVAAFGLALALTVTSVTDMVQSQKVIDEKTAQLEAAQPQVGENEAPIFTLSKTGKNVVVLMMDRGFSPFVPYIFHEKPELTDQFQGFTYYPNTLSYGPYTNFGLPAVFGGYEYTPLELNKREGDSLEVKHNEALKVMPKLFRENDFRVTVNDPSYAGYDWIPDLSVFNDLPGVETKITMGRYNPKGKDPAQMLKSRFFLYSVFRTAPMLINKQLYDKGNYLTSPAVEVSEGQTCQNNLTASGYPTTFNKSYHVLNKLPRLTEITEDSRNTFQMMCNDATHEPALLQLPDYVPRGQVDNTRFDSRNPVREDGHGHRLVMTTLNQVTHYHINMASFLQLGKWMDYLREEGIYDNTRIIIVADHGRGLEVDPAGALNDGRGGEIAQYNPLLMVKDFNSRESFSTDETFMTNADVPALAAQDLIANPANPFTGKPITMEPKHDREQYILASYQWQVEKHKENWFNEDNWFILRGDMMNPKNWESVEPCTRPDKLKK